MTWATRRRIIYITGVVIFFGIVVGGPLAYHFLTIPPTCHDGPCLMLNALDLQPEGVLWTRAFLVRPGVTDAVAYIDNPNENAGVLQVPYELDVYDDKNTLIQDVSGTTFIMPEGVTPIFVGNIQTGNRTPRYAQFKLKSAPVWEKVTDPAAAIKVSNLQTTIDTNSSEVSANALNTSVSDATNVTFVATVFDPGGNAIATSQTALQKLPAGENQQIYFTWPAAFSGPVGSIDIIPLVQPQPDRTAQQ